MHEEGIAFPLLSPLFLLKTKPLISIALLTALRPQLPPTENTPPQKTQPDPTSLQFYHIERHQTENEMRRSETLRSSGAIYSASVRSGSAPSRRRLERGTALFEYGPDSGQRRAELPTSLKSGAPQQQRVDPLSNEAVASATASVSASQRRGQSQRARGFVTSKRAAVLKQNATASSSNTPTAKDPKDKAEVGLIKRRGIMVENSLPAGGGSQRLERALFAGGDSANHRSDSISALSSRGPRPSPKGSHPRQHELAPAGTIAAAAARAVKTQIPRLQGHPKTDRPPRSSSARLSTEVSSVHPYLNIPKSVYDRSSKIGESNNRRTSDASNGRNSAALDVNMGENALLKTDSDTPVTTTVVIRWESIKASNAVTSKVAKGATCSPGDNGLGSAKGVRIGSTAIFPTRLFYWSRDPFRNTVHIKPIVRCADAPLAMGPADDDLEVVLGLRAVAVNMNSQRGVPLPPDILEHKVWELPEAEGSTNDFSEPPSQVLSSLAARKHKHLVDVQPLFSYREAVTDNNFSMDLVHSYTVSRLTVDMIISDLVSIGVIGDDADDEGSTIGGTSSQTDHGSPLSKLKKGWRWQWEMHSRRQTPDESDPTLNHVDAILARSESQSPRQPLRIICHTGDCSNSAYYRSRRAVQFGFHTDVARRARVYTCRSADMISHEVGHAVLDALCPQLYQFKDNGELAGLHEGFADVVAICAQLERREVRENVIFSLIAHRLDELWSDLIMEVGEELEDGDEDERSEKDAEHLEEASKSSSEGPSERPKDQMSGGSWETSTEFLSHVLSAPLSPVHGRGTFFSTPFSLRAVSARMRSPQGVQLANGEDAGSDLGVLSFLTSVGQEYAASAMTGISTSGLDDQRIYTDEECVFAPSLSRFERSNLRQLNSDSSSETRIYGLLAAHKVKQVSRRTEAQRRRSDSADGTRSAVSTVGFEAGCLAQAHSRSTSVLGVRDADDPSLDRIIGSRCGSDPYALANLLSCFVWDLMVMAFDLQVTRKSVEAALIEAPQCPSPLVTFAVWAMSILQRVGEEVRRLLLASMLSVYSYRLKRGLLGQPHGLFHEISKAMIALSKASARESTGTMTGRSKCVGPDNGNGDEDSIVVSKDESLRASNETMPPLISPAMIEKAAACRELALAGKGKTRHRREGLGRMYAEDV